MMLPKGFEDAPEILAFGGELKSTFCLVKDGQAILSQHQGDLEDVATFDDYQKNLALYRDLYAHRPRVLAADMHPEYLSTKLAKEHARGTALHEVQHHHAHIAELHGGERIADRRAAGARRRARRVGIRRGRRDLGRRVPARRLSGLRTPHSTQARGDDRRRAGDPRAVAQHVRASRLGIRLGGIRGALRRSCAYRLSQEQAA